VPDLLLKFVAGHQLAGLESKQGQHFRRLRLQPENLPALPQLATCKVELELIEPQHVEMARGTQSGSGTG
jgi:hypothetical protein